MYHFSAFTRGLTCAVVGQLLFFLELLHAAVDGQSDVGDGEADVDDVEADAAGPALQGIPSNIVEDGDEGEVPEKDAQELEGLDFVPSFMEEVAEKRDDKEKFDGDEKVYYEAAVDLDEAEDDFGYGKQGQQTREDDLDQFSEN